MGAVKCAMSRRYHNLAAWRLGRLLEPDENGRTLAVLTVANDAESSALLYGFALPFPGRRWAVEGAANRYIVFFVSELLE